MCPIYHQFLHSSTDKDSTSVNRYLHFGFICFINARMGNKQQLGKYGENCLWVLFRHHLGPASVKKCGYYDPFDFVVRGKTIELKTAEPFIPTGGGIPSWTFNLHRHGKMGPAPDFYVFRLQRLPFMGNRALHLLLDGNQTSKVMRVTVLSLMRGDFQKAVRFDQFCKLEGEFSILEEAANV